MSAKKNCVYGLIAMIMLLIPSLSLSAPMKYANFYALGARAASEALRLIRVSPANGGFIAITNAGYAEIEGQTTEGCIDGLSNMTGTSGGKNTLLEIQSRYDKPLWFAVYHKGTGRCAYLEVDPEAGSEALRFPLSAELSELFALISVEKINAEHLYANADEYNDKFDTQKVLGENAFRVVTIANAVAAGAPKYAIRSFEFHDHYCPGITSGILMANYVKTYFPRDNYFVQGISPWCKEDALMVMLNSTPGKSGYAVSFPNQEDTAKWKAGFESAATIIYGQNNSSGKWEGMLLGFVWGDSVCPDYGGSGIITKLCSDLYYLEHLDEPQSYIKVLKKFELSEGETPKDWARPGVDPMKKLGLVQE